MFNNRRERTVYNRAINMKVQKLILSVVCACVLSSCATYTTPPRNEWGTYLRGASMSDMTADAKVAKRPVYLGSGGVLVTNDVTVPAGADYGDKATNDNAIILNYMSKLEYELYDNLLKAGITVQRAGTDVVVMVVRGALMQPDVAELSDDGVDTLKTISKILTKYGATFIEIAGYTDSFSDQGGARKLSLDMAQRVALYMVQNNINPTRMFIVGRGSARPIAAQDDVGRQTNRRVEIRISPAR